MTVNSSGYIVGDAEGETEKVSGHIYAIGDILQVSLCCIYIRFQV